MIEIDTLPIIEAKHERENSVDFDLKIQANLVWFKGHFPGLPILPGVVQIEWALHLASRHFGPALGATRLMHVKFKSVICPGDRLVLQLSRDQRDGHTNFKYTRGNIVCSLGSLMASPL